MELITVNIDESTVIALPEFCALDPLRLNACMDGASVSFKAPIPVCSITLLFWRSKQSYLHMLRKPLTQRGNHVQSDALFAEDLARRGRFTSKLLSEYLISTQQSVYNLERAASDVTEDSPVGRLIGHFHLMAELVT